MPKTAGAGSSSACSPRSDIRPPPRNTRVEGRSLLLAPNQSAPEGNGRKDAGRKPCSLHKRYRTSGRVTEVRPVTDRDPRRPQDPGAPQLCEESHPPLNKIRATSPLPPLPQPRAQRRRAPQAPPGAWWHRVKLAARRNRLITWRQRASLTALASLTVHGSVSRWSHSSR